MQNEKLAAYLKDSLWPFSVGAIGIGYLASPLLRFGDPTRLISLGVYGTVALMFLHWSFREPSGGLFRVLTNSITAITLLFVGGHLLITMGDAEAASIAADKRCLAIQHDMLSAYPRRADSPDLFEALGCRPQGEGSVYAPARRSGR